MEFEIGEIIVNKELEINDIQLDIIKQYPELEDLEVTPSSVEQNFTHPNSYGYDKVKVKEVSANELNITPTKENQQHIGLYGTVNVNGVTSSIDSNIIPSNIKEDVEILGVTGSLQDNLDLYASNNIETINLQKATSVRNTAFQYLSSVKTVILGNSVKTIGDNSFSGCSNLETLTIEGATSIYAYAFRYCSRLYSANLGQDLTSLGAACFMGCTSLQHIKIPQGVTMLRSQTFQGCTGMEYYDFTDYTTIPSLQATDVFYNIPATCKIVVPDDLYATWITRTNWSNFASNIIKESEWNA